MTSKEALEIIVRKHCVSETDKEDKELEKCYKCVMSDLEVLEILKRYTTANGSLFKFINDIRCPDEDFRKAKEWLEK